MKAESLNVQEVLEAARDVLKDQLIKNAETIQKLEEEVDFENASHLGAMKLELSQIEMPEDGGEEDKKYADFLASFSDKQKQYIYALEKYLEEKSSHHNPPNLEK